MLKLDIFIHNLKSSHVPAFPPPKSEQVIIDYALPISLSG